MENMLNYVSGDFEGYFYTHQKTPLSQNEQTPTDGGHNVHLYKGELKNTKSIESYKPEEHLNRDGLFLHNVTNVQLHPEGDSLLTEKKIYDFDQIVLKNVEVVNSWELNDKTYGILRGQLVGKVKKLSSLTSPPPDPSQKNPVIPPPPVGGGTNPAPPPVINGQNNKGCLSQIWDILKWLLLLLLLIILLKLCNYSPKWNIDIFPNSQDSICIKSRDSLIKINDSLTQELKICAQDRMQLDSMKSEIEKRRIRDSGQIGIITVSLAWNTKDDLDLALMDPSGNIINFQKPEIRNSDSELEGMLDVDANRNMRLLIDDPIENIFIKSPKSGRYKVFVNWFKSYEDYPLEEIPYNLEIIIQGQYYNITGTVYERTGNNNMKFKFPVYEFEYPN
jgi:hypothetical protein